MKGIQKVFGVAIFATLFLILSCAPSGELGPEEGASGIQTDESKATPPPTEPPPTEPPPTAPPPAQPTGEFTQGTIRTFFGDGSPAVLASPGAIAIDSNDNLFIAGLKEFPDPTALLGKRTVRGVFKVTPAKEISTVSTEVSRLGFITAMAFDSQGNLFVLEEVFPDQFQAHNVSRLHKISPTGTQTVVADNLTHPRGLLVMGDGRIIVSESDIANRVVELPSAPGGAFKLIAGKQPAGFSGDGGPATNAQLNNPAGLAVDLSGKIYICDASNRRVRAVDAGGIINTVLEFSFTTENRIPIRILTHNNLRIPLVVAEVSMVMDLNKNILAGKEGFSGFSGDGGPAENAELNRPLGLAIDSKGFLYITDFGNNRIRIVNPKRGSGTPFIQ